MNDCLHSTEQEEILSFLRAELTAIGTDGADVFTQGTLHQQVDTLRHFEQACEQLDQALSLSGLVGLAAVCRLLRDNFQALTATATGSSEATDSSEATNGLSDKVVELLENWTQPLCSYLDAVGGDQTMGSVQVLDFISRPEWPLPLPAKARATLLEQLSSAELTGTAELLDFPATVHPEMVSLAVPDDVRHDLLEGLLLELPDQVRHFEASINAYLDSQAMSALDTAQRVAHTIKGAANVVGVAGIANLMHYCEDLLEIAGVQENRLPNDFGELLQTVSDCLASSADFLCGLGPASDNALPVLERVLTTIRCLKGLPSGTAPADSGAIEFDLGELEEWEASLAESTSDGDAQESLPQDAQKSLPQTEGSKTPTADVRGEDQHRFTLPETTADQLLRLAGESQITNTQIMAQIAALQTSIQLSDRYHKQIKTMAAEFEALVQTRTALHGGMLESYGEDDLDPLELERYSELHSFSHRLLELTNDSYEGIAHIAQQLGDLATLSHTQKQHNQDNQALLLALRLVPVETLAARFARCVRQAARLTHKEAQLHIEGGDLLMDSKVLNRIADPIMHLLRNAVDHGLEDDAALRSTRGKPAQGQITLSFAHKGETILIRCRDDGCGLDYPIILDKAIQAGLVEVDQPLAGQSLADQALAGQPLANQPLQEVFLNQLIFLPSFSTRTTVSQTSGRGIGLDAVQTAIKALRGQVTVTSTPGEGSCFEISLPSSILTAHALVVRNDGDRGPSFLSVLGHSIEQLVYVEEAQLYREGGAVYYHCANTNADDERLPVFALNDFTRIHRTPEAYTSTLLIVRKTDGSRVAVGVAAVIASQDLVIKQLGRFCPHPEGVIGATIAGDGTVSPVIDLQKLPGMDLNQEELASLRQQSGGIAASQEGRKTEVPLILIVDDSLSVRRSLAQFVTDMGMRAHTAKDGFEAIHALDQHRPTLILVDMEMPRMNGLELTSHLRANDATRHIPIVMVTSRSTEKHRNLARAAGVDSYLTKPWSDEDLLGTIQRHMTI
jgi:chemotaxis protein histidine kinase CheA